MTDRGTSERTVTAEEIEAAGGLDAASNLASIEAFGLPVPEPDEPWFSQNEADALIELGKLREYWPGNLLIQVSRVYGRLLARIYSESDLLVAEALRSGVWESLDAPELAAVVSSVLYESRGDAPGAPHGTDVPTGKLRRALNQTRRLWTELRYTPCSERCAN